ncbi:TRAPP complex core subunit [Hanseniaspora uvarum]|nr:TRAPP complex core subunit [Hanseniaspora uvarum]
MSSNLNTVKVTSSNANLQVDPDYSKEIFLKQLGEHVYQRNMKKINAEFFNVTYGSFVRTLIEFYDNDAEKCNEKLKAMGENIGSRLIDDFYSKVTNQIPRCSNLKDLGNTIAYVGFKMYINVVPKVFVDEGNKTIKFRFDNNANIFNKFVELPDDIKEKRLYYSNIISGVIQAALAGIALKCDVEFISDTLLDDQSTEIQISNVKRIKDEVPMGQ